MSVIKSKQYPGDFIEVEGRGDYVCIEAVLEFAAYSAHLHLTPKESRRLRKALKAAERRALRKADERG